MELTQIRSRIDCVDEQLVDLFRQRMELCAEAAAAKRREGLPLTNNLREQEILARVGSLAGDELATYTRLLFSTLFELSKSYQASLGAE